MEEYLKKLEKRITEQDKQIKKLTASAMLSERRAILLDKKLARVQHDSRTQLNSIHAIQRTLKTGDR